MFEYLSRTPCCVLSLQFPLLLTDTHLQHDSAVAAVATRCTPQCLLLYMPLLPPASCLHPTEHLHVMQCRSLLEESFLQIEARITSNYSVQRNLWKMWHEVTGLPSRLMIDNNKYVRGNKTFDFTYDPTGHCARKLSKAGQFLWHIICHASDEGYLRSSSDIDKVNALASSKTCAPIWHTTQSPFQGCPASIPSGKPIGHPLSQLASQ